jgi:hypothetical protein
MRCRRFPAPLRDLTLTLALALAASALLPPHAARAQQPGDTLAVLLAALPSIRGELPAAGVVLDPSLLCTARLAGWDCPAAVLETAGTLGLSLRSRFFTRVCPGTESTCRLLGTQALVVLGQPNVGDSTGDLLMDVWWQRSDPRRPLGHRRERLRLTRGPSGWEVADREPVPVPPP